MTLKFEPRYPDRTEKRGSREKKRTGQAEMTMTFESRETRQGTADSGGGDIGRGQSNGVGCVAGQKKGRTSGGRGGWLGIRQKIKKKKD